MEVFVPVSNSVHQFNYKSGYQALLHKILSILGRNSHESRTMRGPKVLVLCDPRFLQEVLNAGTQATYLIAPSHTSSTFEKQPESKARHHRSFPTKSRLFDYTPFPESTYR